MNIVKQCLSILLMILTMAFCSASSAPSLPDNFNNCKVSLDKAISTLAEIKSDNSLNFEYRIVREVTDRDECIDMILGTNLDQGSELQNGLLVDLVVGVLQGNVTESVKGTEYDLYLSQLSEKGLIEKNLIASPQFGDEMPTQKLDGMGVITYIQFENPLGYEFIFSEAEGRIYGVKEDNVTLLLDLSDITIRERESGLHSFEFYNNDSADYLLVTHSGIDKKYYLSSYLIENNNILKENKVQLAAFNINDNNVHFSGKILKNNNELIICLGDQNNPGNSAKFDSPWGKVLSLNIQDSFSNPIQDINDERVTVLAYGLRNPWSCFMHGDDLIVPDVGNSHWEEINVLSNVDNLSEPVFFGWPWFESYFDANYKNTPVSEEVRLEQIKNTNFPKYLFPHGNDYCAVIGGTKLSNTNKWKDFIFVGDFCTGTIWAIDIKNNSELKILEKNVIPFSITTINDSGNESLVIGTTSGQIFELELP